MKKDSDYKDYDFMWVRWKPTLLKPLYKIVNKKSSNGGNKTAEKTERVAIKQEYEAKAGIKKRIFKSPFVRKMWLGLATLDYFFQFYAKTLKMLLKKRNIIFDRYYLDLFVDQGINFGYSPNRIHREIKRKEWLFPKMNKIVYIRVNPRTCYERKDDIPNMEYLEKRYEIYEYISKADNWDIIDGNEPLAEVNKKIKQRIIGD